MTKSKWLKLLKSGALFGSVTSLTTALLTLKDIVSPTHAMWIVVGCTMLNALSQSLPNLILEILDDQDVILGESGQSSIGTEVPK